MPRKRQHPSLRVLLNNQLVGHLRKEPGGAIDFRYDPGWLRWDQAIPVSLSLPLREAAFKGAPVTAVFENLLPDSDKLRQRVAEKVGAEGTDSYSLLAQIGRDCVGALQFVPDDGGTVAASVDTSLIRGEVVDEREIETILKNLTQAPLGLGREQAFRISVAGAHEKTALLFHEGKWWKPHGTTPTTHLFKTAIGTLPNGIDLSASVENEWYCLKLLAAFGLPVSVAEIQTFGKTKALVVERFDREWTSDDRLLRRPQEDFCQSLSVPPGQKYQSEGGPGMVDILRFLGAGDTPAEDQKTFLKAQVLYWLIGATDGHSKNFSVFLGSAGRFKLTPLYDVLTAQPSLDAGQIGRKQMKLAMSVGSDRQYAIAFIEGRHFIQTAERAGLPATLARSALEEVARDAEQALAAVGKQVSGGVLEQIHASVHKGVASRLAKLQR